MRRKILISTQVSTSVGVALCADCAAAHRRLGGDFGRLRALSLDAWSPLVLDYLLQSAGNERAREVWEAVGPPTGWSRPAPDAPACVKIKILRRVHAESSRRPPRHRRDACSIAWRCRFLAARRSQDGRAIAEK